MRSPTPFSRWGRRSTLSAPSSLRVEVRPPSLCHAPGGGWQRLMFWLLAPAPADAAPPLDRLPAVRDDFLRCLHDVPAGEGTPGAAVRRRIAQSHTLRDLWHARSDLYRVIALAHSQGVAEQRVDALNRHFPTRAPRSQFAPLL